MTLPITHWRGEGRQLRRDHFRRLTFWPTVNAVTIQGGTFFEVCRFPCVPEFGVEACSNGSPCGSLDYLLPPPHSIITEEDYVSPWDAQQRALWLEVSAQAPILAPHMDKMFFENFIHDRRHPVPHEDLLALDILPISDSSCPAQQTYHRQNRPDPNEVPNLPDPPNEEEPGQHGTGAADRRTPLHRFPAWVEQVWNVLQQEGATELLEEGPVIYLDTFYVSHDTCRRQNVNRPLRLDQH